jgi:hygromycin-B 4-O-kinase
LTNEADTEQERTMTDVKPQVDEAAILALLRGHFAASIEGLAVVTGGQVAQTYTFAADGEDYIIRFNRRMGANFEKEVLISQRYASPRIPIPPVVHLGRLGELRYAISRRMPGKPLTELPPAENEALLPALLDALEAIHACDVADQPGYGIFGDDGVGLFPSWRQYLAAIREEDPEWDFYGKWHALFDTTFLERDVFELIYGRMVNLLDYCSEEKWLVHGSYGFGNVLAHEGHVSGVLDWLDAKYGDFVYDIAWLDFWAPQQNIPARSAERYARRGIGVPHFAERLRCYECYIGLDALRFFAKGGNEGAYRGTREHVLALLQ